jgi:hypothetical protein
MKKSDKKFEWTEEADQVFGHLKKVLSMLPVLVAPNEKEPLLLYIAAPHQVVSTVLIVERSEEGKAHRVQRPIYFLREVLSPYKQWYPHYQNLAYNVFMTARKLRHYFAVHPIIVVNEVPLSNILNNPEATGRVSLWGIEISPGHHVREKNSHQSANIARFPCRMARITKHGTTRFIEHLGDVFQWVQKSGRCRSRSGADITTRR